jgi:hypothetical protein
VCGGDAFDWRWNGIDSEQSPATLRAMRGSIAGIVSEISRIAELPILWQNVPHGGRCG